MPLRWRVPARRAVASCFLLLFAGAIPPTQAQPSQPAPLPFKVLVKRPAGTGTELQVFCLFPPEPTDALHGSLVEMNKKGHGLLDQIWTSAPPNGKHPVFAPTILDGGVTGFGTGEVVELELKAHGVSAGETVEVLSFLAGAAHVSDTQAGIARAINEWKARP
jgi:hypothetical protein